MATARRNKPTINEPFEKFKWFATAIMAMPKKELDEELAKHERKKHAKKKNE